VLLICSRVPEEIKMSANERKLYIHMFEIKKERYGEFTQSNVSKLNKIVCIVGL